MELFSYYRFLLLHPLKARAFSGGSHTETGGLSRSLYDCLSNTYIGSEDHTHNPF